MTTAVRSVVLLVLSAAAVAQVACAGTAGNAGSADAGGSLDGSAGTGPHPSDAGNHPEDGSAPKDAASGASTDAAAPAEDASVNGSDAAGCVASLAPGALVVDEMMLSSGPSPDYGEWLEVANASGCAVDLKGLHAEVPHGTKADVMDVVDDLWLSPGQRFVIADSADPAVNNDLPGVVLVWSGAPHDVLANDSGTVLLSFGGTTVDALTYAKLPIVQGASVAFPNDCPATSLGDWSRWQSSTNAWTSGFLGTPGTPNTDVTCP